MNKPDSKLTIKIDGEDFTTKMTYGLQMDFMRMIPSLDQLESLYVGDPYLREYIVRRCLTPGLKKPAESLDELVDIYEKDIDPDDILKIQAWVAEYLLYFFVTSADQLKKSSTTPPTDPAPPPPSKSGSKD